MSSIRRIGPTAVAWVCAILIGCTDTGNTPLEPGSRIWLSSLESTTNEPAGATPISDQPWDTVGSRGWVHASAGKSRIVVDSGPASPGHAIEFPFNIGDSGANAGVDWYPLAGLKRVYARIWWKASSPWEGHPSNVNEIAAVHAVNTDGQMYLTMYGPPGGPYELRMQPQFSGLPDGWLVPNRNSGTVTLGAWHQVEWLIDYQANASAGTIRWWLDGQLVGEYTDVPFPDQGLDAFALTPYWGGSGAAKTENDWFRFDHSYLSGPWTDAAPPWPNEPAGLTSVTDYGFNDPIPAVRNDTPLGPAGWYVDFNDSGWVTHSTMSTAPSTPPDVAQFRYPIHFHDGSAPGTIFFGFNNTARKEVFTGFWWKPSSPWEGHWSNVNKIAFWFPANNGDIFLAMYGPPGGPYRLRSIPQFPGLPSLWRLPNVDSTPVMLGVWHRVEWYVKYATTPQGNDGVVKWWLDGVLQGEHHDLQTPADAGFAAMKISPTWGGGDTLHYPYKTEEDFFWYDQFHIAAR